MTTRRPQWGQLRVRSPLQIYPPRAKPTAMLEPQTLSSAFVRRRGSRAEIALNPQAAHYPVSKQRSQKSLG